MENFGFPPHFHQTLHEFPLCKVNALLAGKLEAEGAEGGPEGAGEPQEERALDGAEGEEEAPEETQEMEVNTEGDESKEKERQERRRERKVRTGVEDFSPLVVFGTFFFFFKFFDMSTPLFMYVFSFQRMLFVCFFCCCCCPGL